MKSKSEESEAERGMQRRTGRNGRETREKMRESQREREMRDRRPCSGLVCNCALVSTGAVENR